MKKAILLLFGLFLFLVLLEAGLRLGGFMMLSMQEYRNTLSIRQKGTYRILCLGESTTQNQWPPYLEKILNGKHMGIGFSVIDKGMTGTITSAILSKVESYVNEYHPDMVVAMMGVNDFALHMPYDKPDSSKTIAFVRSLRTYKLARLLWLHMENKIKSSYARPEKANADIKTPAFSQRNEGTPVEISQLYRDRGQFRQAEECIKKALELSPENDGAYVELGWIYHDMGQFPQAEECVKKALELNPRNDWAYVARGQLYHDRGQFRQAEESFKKALELSPRNDGAYVELGQLYNDIGRFQQAEDFFKKALALNPRNEGAYVELGRLSHYIGQFPKAEECFKKAMELNPRNDGAYVELGRLYRDNEQFPKAEECFKKALEINPKNDGAYVELGRLSRVLWQIHQADERYGQAVECFKKAMEINPKNDWAYVELGWLYHYMGQFSQAEACFKEALALNQKNSSQFYGALGAMYEQMKQFTSAQECYSNANRIRLSEYNPMTVYNYNRLKDILDKRKIKLACVQYPMRNIEPLKKIFQGNRDGILFVDNEKIFKDAVKQSSYKMYFVDMFGGDFGHCTPQGNSLLAENIAETIAKYITSKYH